MIKNAMILFASIVLILILNNVISEHHINSHSNDEDVLGGDHSSIDYVLRDHPISATSHQYLDGRDWIVYKADDIDNINSYLIDYKNTFQGNTTITINNITTITITIR